MLSFLTSSMGFSSLSSPPPTHTRTRMSIYLSKVTMIAFRAATVNAAALCVSQKKNEKQYSINRLYHVKTFYLFCLCSIPCHTNKASENLTFTLNLQCLFLTSVSIVIIICCQSKNASPLLTPKLLSLSLCKAKMSPLVTILSRISLFLRNKFSFS